MRQRLALPAWQVAAVQGESNGAAGRRKLLQAMGKAEDGSSLVELSLLVPILSLMMMGVVDLGRGYYLAIEVSHSANAGAVYGSQNPTDKIGMQNAAVADAADVAGFSTSNVTVTTGCECSDGSSPSSNCSVVPTCSANVVNFVQVRTAFTYQTMIPYPGIPNTLLLTGNSRMRAEY